MDYLWLVPDHTFVLPFGRYIVPDKTCVPFGWYQTLVYLYVCNLNVPVPVVGNTH